MKRQAVSESATDTNDSAFRSNRIMAGSLLDDHRAEQSQLPKLDMQRAELSQRHVRALNTQFASWVQTQIKNHPDELWEDGIRDYLAHASGIMAKFSDVVSWLKANGQKAGNVSASEPHSNAKPLIFGTKSNEVKLPQEKPFTAASMTSSSASLWGFTEKNSVPKKVNNEVKLSQDKMFSPTAVTSSFATSVTPPTVTSSFGTNVTPTTTTSIFATNVTPTTTSSIFATNVTPTTTTSIFATNVTPSAATSTIPTNVTSTNATPSFASPWGSGVFSNSQTSGLFGIQTAGTINHNTSNDDDEDEAPQPSSPSVKKSEEKGIVVVHEVKCKLYVKSSDPTDKDTWKDKGTGQLTIKCKEGVDKGAKESKPTILVRNDVGKVLLNALLYPGIKTNLQKNSLVAIFHTSSDEAGNNDSVVARTFLIRTKTEEDRNKLATTIKEYAPAL